MPAAASCQAEQVATSDITAKPTISINPLQRVHEFFVQGGARESLPMPSQLIPGSPVVGGGRFIVTSGGVHAVITSVQRDHSGSC
jgi:hypothetical protein